MPVNLKTFGGKHVLTGADIMKGECPLQTFCGDLPLV